MLPVTKSSFLRLSAWSSAAALAFLALAASAAENPAPKASSIPPFEVAKVGPRTWAGRFGLSNCGWVELGTGVLVIDTGASEQDALNLQSEIKKSTEGKPVKWIVMTHRHGHSNNGLPSFLQAGATLYVHGSIESQMEATVKRIAGQKAPMVIGVKQGAVISDGGHSVEVFASKGASSGFDLWVFAPDSKAAFVGDIVVAGRCPTMTDPGADPVAWGAELTRIAKKEPVLLVGSAGDTSQECEAEIAATRAYLERIYRVAKDARDRNLPEAAVSSRLAAIEKIGEYCDIKLDVANGLAIYRRLGSDGAVRKESPPSGGPRPGKP